MEEKSIYSAVSMSHLSGVSTKRINPFVLPGFQSHINVLEKLEGRKRGHPMQLRQEALGHTFPKLISTATAQVKSKTRSGPQEASSILIGFPRSWENMANVSYFCTEVLQRIFTKLKLSLPPTAPLTSLGLAT